MKMFKFMGLRSDRQAVMNRQLEFDLAATQKTLSDLQSQQTENYKMLLRMQIAAKWQLIDLHDSQIPQPAFYVCPLCNHGGDGQDFIQYKTHCMFEGGVLLRHQCPACDLIFGDEKVLRLTEQDLASEYLWHYQVFSEGDSTELEMRAFFALKPDRHGVYLNWGSGAWSKTLDQLRAQGWNVYGYEPHGASVSERVGVITSQSQIKQMRFDGIFSNNVLEHLRYPVRDLKQMAVLLNPGGKMSHATPCFEYRYEFTRFHLFFYLGRSRQTLAQQADLDIHDYCADGDYMNIIFHRK